MSRFPFRCSLLAAVAFGALGCMTSIGSHPPAASGRGDLLVVTNKQANTASIIDVGTRETVAVLPTGEGPHEVAVSSDGRWAVATDYGHRTPGNSLTVIDLDRLEVARTISLGEYRRPHGAAFLPGNWRLAVTSEANQAVVLVDFERGVVEKAIPTGQRGSHMLAIPANGRRIFTANVPEGSVSELDVESGRALRTLRVAPMTEGIAVTPDGSQIWVGSNEQGTVTVLDARTGQPLDTLASPGMPYRVSVSPDGRRAVVSNPQTSEVQIWDVATRQLLATVRIPADPARVKPNAGGSAGPVGGVVSPDGRTAYITLQGTDQVAIVDLDAARVTGFLETGEGPDGIGLAVRRGR